MTARPLMRTVAVLALLGIAMPAMAQESAKLEKRVDTLEGQMKAVQRKVFPGGSPRYFEPEVAPAAPAAAATAGVAAGTNPVGDLQSRVDALEKQLATLTGQVEEATHRARLAEELVAKLREDYEFRLQQLEGARSPAAAAAPAAVAGTSPAAAPAKPAAVVAAKPAEIDPKAAPGAARQAYDKAYALVAEQKYDQAEVALQDYLKAWPKAPEASNAAYWLGRTYFNRKLYAQAAKSFLDGYRQYPRGEKGADSLLGLGDSLVALNKPGEACQAYNELTAVYPNASPAVKKRVADARAKSKCI